MRNLKRTNVREGTVDAAEMRQWDKGPRHETAATSRKREDIQQSPRPDFRTGSHGADSQIFDQTVETEHLTTVEVSAPAKAEEIVP
jgi:hypothetical protein